MEEGVGLSLKIPQIKAAFFWESLAIGLYNEIRSSLVDDQL